VESWSGAVSDDLFDADALRRYGLSAGTLAAVGAITGTVVDAAMGGFSLGVPTLLGGIGGVAAGLWLGRRISTQIDAGTLTVGPVDSVQFPAVLLHRAVDCWRQVARRSHADRGDLLIGAGGREALAVSDVKGLMRIARRCGKNPDWSRLGGAAGGPGRSQAVDQLTQLAEQLLRKQLVTIDES